MPNIEEARDLKTGDVYRKNDILDPKKIGIMRERLLVDVHDSEVVLTPVRRSNAPHFRRLCTDPARRLDAVDPDPSHNTCRDALLSAFQGSPVKISTYWFDEDGERHRQVLAELSSGTYQWWRETRVNAGRGEYIQPDLMGRDATVFLPNAVARGVVIEVIRTHHPNRATFFSLLTMSRLGFLVIFYFIPTGKQTSKYNQFHTTSDEKGQTQASLYITYYMLDGVLWANAAERKRPQHAGGTEYSDQEWYEYLTENYFKTPMAQSK